MNTATLSFLAYSAWSSIRGERQAGESNTDDQPVFSGSLWVSVVLNPRCDRDDRSKWTSALETWAKLEICPLEDPDHRHHSSSSSGRGSHSSNSSNGNSHQENSYKRPRLGPYHSHKKARRSHKPRTIFHQALDALQMDWKDPILVKILQKDNVEIHPWNEHLPTACARIDALRY